MLPGGRVGLSQPSAAELLLCSTDCRGPAGSMLSALLNIRKAFSSDAAVLALCNVDFGWMIL